MKEQIKERIKKIKSDWTFKEEFSKTSHYKSISIWEKYGKFRVYVPRNAYEQAGYITVDSQDLQKYNSGEHKGLFYQATRPGNVNGLINFINALGV